MDSRRDVLHLKLVSGKTTGASSSDSSSEEEIQSTLFPMAIPSQMVFINTARLIRANSFIDLLEEVTPKSVIDLRPVPRFDFCGLNRTTAFDLFERYALNYVDVTGLQGITSKHHEGLKPETMVHFLKDILEAVGKPSEGPLVFLFDNDELMFLAAEIFPGEIKQPPQGKWQVFVR
ncbi:MAG: hypothetical protein OJF52_000464 [Nitrospira sp.]|jgi:hypothetical protein|nr:MAG: hypothetical protein OJF52_000464 [Nitrospira sp.]